MSFVQCNTVIKPQIFNQFTEYLFEKLRNYNMCVQHFSKCSLALQILGNGAVP